MEALKRVEIIVPRSELDLVLELLENQNVSGYTVIEKVRGKGHRGVQDGLGLTDAFTNAMVIWYGKFEAFEAIKEDMRSKLKEAGGICAVSDAQWVIH